VALPLTNLLDTLTEFSSNTAMTRNPITVKKVVTLLSNAQPTFVSLVAHGANQTPFKSVKVADLSEIQPTQKTDMTKPASTPVVKGAETSLPQGTDINKIVFSGAQFTSPESVTSYLTGKGYANFNIEQLDGSFVVKAIDETAFESLTPVVAQEGVTFFVGKLVTAANPPVPVAAVEAVKTADPVAPAAPAAAAPVTARTRTRAAKGDRPQFLVAKGAALAPDSLVQKYGEYLGAEPTCANMLEDICNGLPLGYWDVSDAFRYALRARLAKGDVAGIATLATEFGSILTKLVTLTTTVEKSEDQLAAFDKIFPTQKALGTQVPTILGIPLDGQPGVIAQPGTLPAAPTTVNLPTTGSQPGIQQPGTGAAAGGSPNVDPNPQPAIAQPGTLPAAAGTVTLPTGTVPEGGELDPSKIGAALAALQNTLAQLIAGQAGLATKADIDGVTQRVTKADERLNNLERVRQTRKSVDSDDVPVVGVTKTAQQQPVQLSRTQKNIMGIQ